jgi:hypothetical protein
VIATFTQGGRITELPRQRSKRLVLLDLVAQDFEPGLRYTETMVNLFLGRRYRDPATIRRYLVDEGFLDREPDGSAYWRSGGSVQGS